eukprot:Colp12_sorted_trinity150504_noHs@27830
MSCGRKKEAERAKKLAKQPGPLWHSEVDTIDFAALEVNKTVKILKRANDAPAANNSTPSVATKATISTKSLAEREAEYARARARILGEAESIQDVAAPGNEGERRAVADPAVVRQPEGPDGSRGFKQARTLTAES